MYKEQRRCVRERVSQRIAFYFMLLRRFIDEFGVYAMLKRLLLQYISILYFFVLSETEDINYIS